MDKDQLLEKIEEFLKVHETIMEKSDELDKKHKEEEDVLEKEYTEWQNDYKKFLIDLGIDDTEPPDEEKLKGVMSSATWLSTEYFMVTDPDAKEIVEMITEHYLNETKP